MCGSRCPIHGVWVCGHSSIHASCVQTIQELGRERWDHTPSHEGCPNGNCGFYTKGHFVNFELAVGTEEADVNRTKIFAWVFTEDGMKAPNNMGYCRIQELIPRRERYIEDSFGKEWADEPPVAP